MHVRQGPDLKHKYGDKITTRCKVPGRRLNIGSSPNAVAVDQHSNTVYVTNTYQTGSLTVFAGRR